MDHPARLSLASSTGGAVTQGEQRAEEQQGPGVSTPTSSPVDCGQNCCLLVIILAELKAAQLAPALWTFGAACHGQMTSLMPVRNKPPQRRPSKRTVSIPLVLLPLPAGRTYWELGAASDPGTATMQQSSGPLLSGIFREKGIYFYLF